MYARGLVKVPYECVNLEFRACQKQVEKDVANITQLLRDLATTVKKQEQVNWGKVVEVVRRMENRVQSLRDKVKETAKTQANLLDRSSKRIRFLKDEEQKAGKELNMLVTDYLLRRGYSQSASMLAKQTEVEALVDTNVFENVYKIMLDLREGQLDSALKWCSERKSRLKRIDSSLEFSLRRLAFLELVCQGQEEEAVQYAKKYLLPHAPDHMSEIQKTVTLIAFTKSRKKTKMTSPQTSRNEESHDSAIEASENGKRKRTSDASPEQTNEETLRQRLLPHSEWGKVIKQFETDSNKLLGISQRSHLQLYVEMGLSALKTKQCATTEKDTTTKCPCCQPVYSRIAASLPYAQHPQSSLVCRISGEIMDEHNPPMALPNGHVYSLNALQKLAAQDEKSMITCPATKERYNLHELSKVYIL